VSRVKRRSKPSDGGTLAAINHTKPPKPTTPPNKPHPKPIDQMSYTELQRVAATHPYWGWYSQPLLGNDPTTGPSSFSAQQLRHAIKTMRARHRLEQAPIEQLGKAWQRLYGSDSAPVKRQIQHLSDPEIEQLLQLCRNQPKGETHEEEPSP
jgi:hypothetical protein